MRWTCLLLCLVLPAGLPACGDGSESPGDSAIVDPGPSPDPAPSPEPAPDAPAAGADTAADLAGKFVDSLNVNSMIPSMLDEVIAGLRKETPDLTDEQIVKVRASVQRRVEADLRGMLVRTMTDYFNVDDLRAMNREEMTPALEKKLPGWQEFSKKRGFEWGKKLGEEAMEEALEED